MNNVSQFSNIKFNHIFSPIVNKILDLIPVSFYCKDLKGTYITCNQYMLDMVGFKNREDIIGKTDFDLVWKDIAIELRKIDLHVMETQKAYEVEETPNLINQQKHVYLTTKTPFYDNAGKVAGIIGISIDITERKKAEIALQESIKQERIINDMKTAFIKNMEHDIRTPFIGILNLSEILAQDEIDFDKKKLLSDVVSCTKELLEYFNVILDFSKIESSLAIKEQPFRMKELANSIMTIIKPACMAKKLDFILDYDDNLPSVLIGDPYRVKKLLLNLVGNAVKFTKEGYIKLHIQASKYEQNSRYVIVKFNVEDTGIGIPNEKKEFIFESFTKGTLSNRSSYKGTGLGLKIVKQFIEDLDGDIHLESSLNKGSVFTVFLKLKIPLSEEFNESVDVNPKGLSIT